MELVNHDMKQIEDHNHGEINNPNPTMVKVEPPHQETINATQMDKWEVFNDRV